MMDFDKELEDLFNMTPVENPKDTPTGKTISVELDSEVLRIEEERKEPYAAGIDLIAKRNELQAARELSAEVRTQINEINAEIEKIKKEYQARVQQLTDTVAELNEASFKANRAVRQAQYNVQTAENMLRDALAAERSKRKFIENSLKYDEITLNMPWREHAYPHQIDGAKLLASADRAILADKMGLGKTLTSLIFCDMKQSQKVLVVVPDDVVSNFVNEVKHWAPHRTVIQLGKMTKMERDMLINVMRSLDEFLVVINYSAWRKDKSLLDRLVELRFDTVIMDEAHNVKNVSTSAFKGCEKIVLAENSCPECGGAIQHVHDSSERESNYINDVYVPRDFYVCIGDATPSSRTVDMATLRHVGCGWSQNIDTINKVKRPYGYLRSVKYLIPMTGTVILNRPTDIFALLRLIDDMQYDNQNQFIRDYCTSDPYSNKIYFRSGGLDRLTSQLAGKYVARDRKTAGVILPKQEIIVHDIELDPIAYAQQYKIIKQLSEHAMLMLDSGKTLPIPVVIALITRKRQANVWPGGIEIKDEDGFVIFSVGEEVQESAKLDKIIMEPSRSESGEYEGLIPDVTGMGDLVNGDRVVVFSQFKQPLIELERRLNEAGISVVRFDGDTPEALRDEIKIDFDRKYCDAEDYEIKWQVVLANYKTGGVGLNFTGATQMIILDEEWNPGKADQAYGRIDRMGQTEETSVHILRLEKTIDTWMSDLIDEKRDIVAGFETTADIANSLLRSLRDGDIL